MRALEVIFARCPRWIAAPRVPPRLWLLRVAVCAVLLARPAVGAAPAWQEGDCAWNPVTRQCVPDELLYAQPVAGLDAAQMRLFDDGLKQFRAPWTVFPRADGEWGLGPYFHANSCAGCHLNVGRGAIDEESKRPLFQPLVRLSVPHRQRAGDTEPHPVYDTQMQPFSIFGPSTEPVSGEADVHVEWLHEKTVLADGTEVPLRRPKVTITNAKFGALDEKVMISLRNTPALLGLGYLDAVSEADILALAAAQQALGFNGRPNYVSDDSTGRKRLGRFGWKANQPSISQQVAAAHLGDMGITSSLYPDDDCTGAQQQCLDFGYKKSAPELTDAAWRAVNLFMAATDAPRPRRAETAALRRGGQLFRELNCAVCHVPALKAGKYDPLPALEGRSFHPYTDLLLHDMGAALADGRPDFKAGPRDWRTAPLWGIGVSARVNGSADLLHDGRARNVTEAILWHGGEAQRARDGFARLGRDERDALVAFVNSL